MIGFSSSSAIVPLILLALVYYAIVVSRYPAKT
jgi:hypothetical protein